VPLAFTGECTESPSRKLYRATGSQNEPVVVEVSQEALTDYGEARALQRASEKYDAGATTVDGNITVLSSDLSR
jgi:hypothetical protein